jgi:hypothetical protein
MKPAGFELRPLCTLDASVTLDALATAPLLIRFNESNESRVKMKKGRGYKLAESGGRGGRFWREFLRLKKRSRLFQNNLRFLAALDATSNRAGLSASTLPGRRFTLDADLRAEKSTKGGLAARAGR